MSDGSGGCQMGQRGRGGRTGRGEEVGEVGEVGQVGQVGVVGEAGVLTLSVRVNYLAPRNQKGFNWSQKSTKTR